MAKKSGNRNQRPQKVGIAQSVRDVLIASMNKGQFPLALLALITLAVLYKMPGEDVSRLVFTYATDLANNGIIGYVLFGITALSWFVHAKWQRRKINREMARMGREKTKWQEIALGKKLETSE